MDKPEQHILLDIEYWRHLQAVEDQRLAYIQELETKVLDLEQRILDVQTELDKANTLIELAIKTSLVLATPEESPVKKPKIKRKERRQREKEEYNGAIKIRS